MGLAAISVLRSVARELYSISGYQECRKALYILAFAVSVLVATLIIVQETDSTALSAYSSLTIFDILFLLSALLSAWAARQETTLAYSYGYSRFEVLAVFTCTMLAQLNSFFIVKESVEHMFENDEDGHEHAHTASHTSGSTKHSSEKRQPLAVTVGAVLVAVCHYACVYLVRHPAFDHVTRWCSSSWIQEQVAEISHSICRVLPFLSVFLLPRLNPLSLIASVGLLMLMLTKLMVEVYNYHFADTGAAITFAALLIYTWLPMTKFTGRILLQSTPPHLLTQRDKIMNEIGTLDGVLEVKDDKLWTCGFSSLVVTVKVRVRRDANEQMVLAHIHDKLSILASEVTVQLVKDIDWSNAPRQFHWQHDAHMDNDGHSGHGHSHSHGGHGGHDHSHDHGGHGHDHDHALPQPRFNGGGGSEDFVVIDFDRNYGTPSTAAAPQQHSHSHEHSHEAGAMHNHSHDHHSVAQPPSTNTYNFSAGGDNFYAGAAVAPFQKPPSGGFPMSTMPPTYSTNLPPIDRSLVPPSAAAASLTPNSRRYGVELSAGGDGVVSNRANAAASSGSLLPSVLASSSNAANFAPPSPYYGKKD